MATRKTKTEDTKAAEQQAADSEEVKAAEQQAADSEEVKTAEQQAADPDAAKAAEQQPKKYKITCRNKIAKQIGGVDFKDGVGYTFDGYAASWFAAKDGYTVERAE
ncbi:MAG: hypothetical protein OSJ72_17005 [Lachnospiraceae bacterium]|nr:hypothetical protein [Lachnospiraceae bacterium]